MNFESICLSTTKYIIYQDDDCCKFCLCLAATVIILIAFAFFGINVCKAISAHFDTKKDIAEKEIEFRREKMMFEALIDDKNVESVRYILNDKETTASRKMKTAEESTEQKGEGQTGEASSEAPNKASNEATKPSSGK